MAKTEKKLLSLPLANGHSRHCETKNDRESVCSSCNTLDGLPECGQSQFCKLVANCGLGDSEEIEAVEACKWLRATGFPQYAQLYEDGQFPIDISVVEKDHDFLDRDSIQSLFRRLNTLNKCALMKIYAQPKKGIEESDDDDLCALSDRWEFQKDCRRWSRKDIDPNLGRDTVKSCSSHDSLLTDQDSSSQAGDSPVLDTKMPHDEHNLHNMLERQHSTPDSGTSAFIVSPRLKRAASEKIKSAKNLLKKMESFKTRRGRKFNNNKNVFEISGPVIADRDTMQAKIQHLNCVDISPTSEESPELPTNNSKSVDQSMTDDSMLNSSFHSNSAGDASSKACSPNSQLNHSSALSEYHTAMSQLSQSFDSADLPGNRYTSRRNQSDTDLLEIFLLPQGHQPGKFPINLQNGYVDSGGSCSINYRTGSFSLGKDSYRDTVDSDDTVSARSHPNFRRQLSLDTSMSKYRFSVYDNMLDSLDDTSSEDNVSEATLDISTPNEELSKAQQELDMILHDLFENINGLNRTIHGEDEVDVQSMMKSEEKKSDKVVVADANQNNIDAASNNNNTLHIDTSPSDKSLIHIDTSSMADPTSPASPVSPIEANSVIDNSMDGDNDMTSNSSSSVDPSDQDIPNEEFSQDDLLDNANNRERRDSGVGSSLTRAPSDKKRKKIRWHSFQKSHRPSLTSRDLQINSLTVGQLLVLRKMSLLKLTAIMEKFCPSNRTTGWNWTVPRFMKRSKTPDYSVKNVFGIPLSLILQRTGQPLPQCILYAMRYLRNTAEDAVGIFRKSGVRSRIQKLRDDLEERPDTCNFDDLQAYDVADMFKQFFRELPECLLTVKLSETFISIFTYVQPSLRLEAMQAAIILLPDENREVLQALLLFLSDISQQSTVHQMTASNLAVCFGPSLFNIGGLRATSTPSPKPKHRKNLGVPDAKELMEQKAALECLTYMIIECKKMFMIPPWIYSRLHMSSDKNEPAPLEQYYQKNNTGRPDVRSFGEDTIQQLLKEAHEKNRGWLSYSCQNAVDVCYRKPHDSHPLREWKCTVEIEAPPVEVLNRLLHERHMWDEDMLSWAEVNQISNNADVFQYISNSMAPQPTRHYCLLRYWRTDLAKGACAMVSCSFNCADVPETKGVRAIELASHFLIEPCGAGKCRMIHIARTDTKGRNPEWYNKAYGYIVANYIERIRETFHQNIAVDSRETSV
ncbi:hypothetical protein SNE40_016771 [Patella caerulea]|uniref:Rho GTPase-activating protein 7 n=1 Tax=Patella caerulea TaxID=87958 RepID=A0AAN8PCU1_PATCE